MQITEQHTIVNRNEDPHGVWSLHLEAPANSAIAGLSKRGEKAHVELVLTDPKVIPALDLTKPVTITISQA